LLANSPNQKINPMNFHFTRYLRVIYPENPDSDLNHNHNVAQHHRDETQMIHKCKRNTYKITLTYMLSLI
jgi:hypothetical protein